MTVALKRVIVLLLNKYLFHNFYRCLNLYANLYNKIEYQTFTHLSWVVHIILAKLLISYYNRKTQNYMESQKNNYDSLKVEGFFPTSISQIGYANQQSEIQRYSNAQPKPNDKLPDYQIKINAPDIKQPEPSNQKNDKPQKDNASNSASEDPNNCMPRRECTEYGEKVTGYGNLRDAFSDEEILKAFNILDINKDDVITEDDLTFVLDYIKEDYTQQEVKEMISMLSADKKHVAFQDFKKLGKGQIIPLAKYLLPDQKLKNQGKILQNLSKAELLEECLKKDALSYSKFEQSKKGTKTVNTAIKVSTLIKDKLFMTVPLAQQINFKKRRQLFMSIVTANIEDISRNYQQYRDKVISIQKVAMMLQISLRQTKQLYPTKQQVDSLLVIMEAIAYCRESTIKKLGLCLDMVNNKNTLSVGELSHILQIIKGKDGSVDKKVKAILVGQKISLDQPLLKIVANGLILNYFGIFLQ